MFDALTNRSFRRLWPAAWLWYTCRWVELTVLSWLVLELTDSPSEVALVGVSRLAPMFLLGVVAGSLADRFPKKRVMMGLQTVNLVVSFSMTLVIFARTVQPWHTFVYMFIIGIAWTVDFPVRRSYYSELFEATRLANAMSLESVALTGSSMLGPLLGGSLISLVGYGGTYIVIVAMYLVGFILLLSLRNEDRPRAPLPTGSVTTQLVEGVRMVQANRTIWAVLMVTILMNLLGFSYRQLVPVIARDVLKVGSTLYGVLGAAPGLGSLIGSFVIASRQVRRQVTLFSLGATLVLAALFSFALPSVYLLSLALLLVAGVGISGFGTMQSTIILQAAPPGMRGRAMGVLALAIGVAPLGAFLVGQLAEVIGVQAALALVAGIGFLVLNILRWRFPELHDRAV
ncbi:MAG: MFS transporter [Anaerolineae bacterium]|nr:MFS transporter [Anaerolineae bacterium]